MSKDDNTPIACEITAIDETERQRHNQNALAVFSSVREIKELPDGYRFRLPTDTDIITKAGVFISRERLCCPFFNFTLEVTPGHGPVWLNLTGREAVKSYTRENIVSQLKQDFTN